MNVFLVFVGAILAQKFNFCKVDNWNFGFTDIPVSIIVRSLFQGRGNAAVSIVLVAESAPRKIPPDFTFSLDSDAAHDFIVGQAGIFGTRTVISCQPDNRVVVFVFVNSFNADFVSIKNIGSSWKVALSYFRLEGVRSSFPVARIIRYLMRLV